MTAPSISVIIPAYNVEKYIEPMLLSLMQQEYTDFEAIIVIDAATDHTEEIVRRVVQSDERFKVITLTKNHGVSYSRNAAIDIARGKYISFIDSDDVVAPFYLSYMLDLI